MTQSIYICENRQCKAHHKEVTKMHFKEYRMATGRSPTCDECRGILTWVRDVGEQDHKPVRCPK